MYTCLVGYEGKKVNPLGPHLHSCQCHGGRFWLGAPGPSASWMASAASEGDCRHQLEPETHTKHISTV